MSLPSRRSLHWVDLITINIFFLGLTTVTQMDGLVFPILVQNFVGEATKASYLGQLRLWMLMAALLMQAVMGILSDRSTLPLGRRRPFILAGGLLNLVFIATFGISAGMQGMAGYWFLFVMVLLLQVSHNAGQAAQQALIPDLVPENQRGRYSGIKAVLELPLPLILVAFTIAPLISRGNLWGALGLGMGALLFTTLAAMFAPEERRSDPPGPFDWKPILRLGLMTALFTAIILGMGEGVRFLGKTLTGIPSKNLVVLLMGGAGLLAMIVAVVLGVSLSVRVSIGRDSAGKNPGFTWWVINRLAFLIGATNLSVFAVYFIQARLEYEKETAAGPAALLMTVVGVFILISALPSGWLADHFGRKQLVAISGWTAALGVLIALMAPSLPVIYAGGVFIGIATGLFFAANWALGADIVPRREAGRYLGISNLAGAGAGAVGAYIGGPIADFFTVQFPDVQGLGYVVLFSIYGFMFLFSVLALRGVPERVDSSESLSTAAVQA